jgi:RimJ/RimL family protein N-acetyltransferase
VKNNSDEIFASGRWCYLRPIRVSDAETTFEWRNLDRAFSTLGGAPADVESQIEWISTRPKSELNFVICLASNDISVGLISIIDINNHHETAQTSRFLIGEEKLVAGLPIAVEAMYLCYEKIFLEWKMRKVWGFIASSNWRMIKWQTFLGMKKEGVQEQQLFVGGEIVDAVLLGLTRERYLGYVQNRMRTMIRLMEKKR